MMKSVGELLRSNREKQKKTLESIAKTTQIKLEYLQALEEDEFHRLPSIVAATGFLVTYAQALELDPTTAVALMRRDFPTVQDVSYPILVVRRHAREQRKRIIGIALSLLAVFLVLVSGYGFWSYQRVRQAPRVTILSPEDGEQVISPVVIRGKTASDAIVEIDGQSIGVNQDGDFVTQLDLNPGDHVISVNVKNRYGNAQLTQVMIKVEK